MTFCFLSYKQLTEDGKKYEVQSPLDPDTFDFWATVSWRWDLFGCASQ